MPGDVVAERYELLEVVGTGGMSTVYRAHDRVLERTVALKVLHERLVVQKDVVERFSREAKLVAGLSHQNIVAVIDRGEYEGSPFIVFEYIDGENLKQMLNRTGPLPVERALELTIEIANGLAFAHQKGFVHRDVKPQNVLLNGKGEAKVTDFGIARPLGAEGGETQTGTVLGTCDYISPEQAQGRHVDGNSDIYSLGVVLYELLTGEVLFSGDNFVAVAMQHINSPPPPVTLKRPEVPRRVEAAIEKALGKEPESRFESMAAFRDELQACLLEARDPGADGSATGILPVTAPVRVGRRRRRWPAALALFLVAIAAGVVAIVILTGHGISGNGGGGSGGGGASGPIALKGVRSYDPYGNNKIENPQLVPYATDGKQSTFWSTETYRSSLASLGKPGVGIVLDAGSAKVVHTVRITSDTPGYTAVIQAGGSEGGPFANDSASQEGGAVTTFHLNGANARYYVIWITDLGDNPAVHVNEVTAT